MDILLLGIFWNDQAIITDKSFVVLYLQLRNLHNFNECGEHANYHTPLDIPLSSEYKTKASCVSEETWGAWATTTSTSSRTTTLYLHHAFWYISLQSLHECLNSRFVEDGNTRQRLSFSFPELRYSPLEFNLKKKIANIWQINWDGLSAIKFEAAQIYFLSDVFVDVAVVVA